MWVINKSGFFSVVQHNKDAGVLMIRARVVDDLVRAFPDDIDKIVELETADYRYRISLPRLDVEQWMLDELDDVTYTSHAKEEMSKGKPGRYSAYMSVWSVLGDLQPGGPYGHAIRRPTYESTREPEQLKTMFSAGEVVEIVGQTEHDADLVRVDGELIDVYAIEDEIECGVCGEPVMLSVDRESWEHAFTDEDDDHEATAITVSIVYVDPQWIYTEDSKNEARSTDRVFAKQTKTGSEMTQAISQLKGRLNNE
jgi:hypothetical protein